MKTVNITYKQAFEEISKLLEANITALNQVQKILAEHKVRIDTLEKSLSNRDDMVTISLPDAPVS